MKSSGKFKRINHNNDKNNSSSRAASKIYHKKIFRNRSNDSKKQKKDVDELLSRRAFIFLSIQSILFTVLAVRFFFLQKVHHLQYRSAADKNRLKTRYVVCERGVIIDRNKALLANNAREYSLLINGHFLYNIELIIGHLERILKQKSNLSQDDIRQLQRQPALKHNQDATIFTNLNRYQIIQIQQDFSEIDEVSIQIQIEVLPTFNRDYIYGSLLACVIGYVGVPNKKERSSFNVIYPGMIIGKSGAEKSYDLHLRPTPTVQSIETDSYGYTRRIIKEKQGENGKTLRLSIDLNLQQFANELMTHHDGVVLVSNIITGEVLVMLSKPSYNPNLFTKPMTSTYLRRSISTGSISMLNKATHGLYPPGSIFKICAAFALLDDGVHSDDIVYCNGSIQIGNRIFHCHCKWGHGKVNLHDALVRSCNVYFYQQALKIGIDKIAKAANIFGFGKRTNIVIGDSNGCVPTPNWKYQRYRKVWTQGDTANTTIGQGFLLATPIQLTQFMSIIANNGLAPAPQIIHSDDNRSEFTTNCGARNIDKNIHKKDDYKLGMIDRINNDSKSSIYASEFLKKDVENNSDLDVDFYLNKIVDDFNADIVNDDSKQRSIFSLQQRQYLAKIRDAMREVITHGTCSMQGKRSELKIQVGGKTSTSQVISRKNSHGKKYMDHSMFAGFFPYDKPQYAITVIAENSGWGSEIAAAIAFAMINRMV